MKILVVDDSATMRKIVSLTLSGAGHSFTEAENGLKALEAMKSAEFDCIILDINMPEMNGIEFLKAYATASSKKIPILVLTTQDEEALKTEALALGAKDFLIKPFQKEGLLAAIKAAFD
jgi:two-component system chemotaxis response regulator CheY